MILVKLDKVSALIKKPHLNESQREYLKYILQDEVCAVNIYIYIDSYIYILVKYADLSMTVSMNESLSYDYDLSSYPGFPQEEDWARHECTTAAQLWFQECTIHVRIPYVHEVWSIFM